MNQIIKMKTFDSFFTEAHLCVSNEQKANSDSDGNMACNKWQDITNIIGEQDRQCPHLASV